jgi:phospholipase/carboxylesterase
MRKLGSLQCLDLVQDEQAPWVIMFHGYGADASDLSTLGDMIPTKTRFNYLFPNAFLEVPIGPGWTGRAWWNIDMARIQKDAAEGIERDTSDEIPKDLPVARAKAMKMIEELGVPWDKIILAGFSQGGMLAVDLALHAPVQPKGLAILSGALVNKVEWKGIVKNREGLPFFQAHGDKDPVIPFRNASRLESLLTSGGLKGSLSRFSGGHEIPPLMIQKLAAYLDSL